MSRFLYYLIFTNMMAIITTPIPRILLVQSEDGAIGSMLVGTAAGMIFMYITIKFFIRFPGMDFIDLLQAYTSNRVRIPVTIYFAIFWYISGLITLIMTVFLLITFLTPVMSIYTITCSIVITVFFGVLLKSKSVLFTMEIVVILLIPVALLMFFKLFTASEVDWDQTRLAIMHINQMPKYSSIVATSFMFLGCSNLIIFNRYFKEQQHVSMLSLVFISLFAVLMLVTSYFIPIGLSGFDRIEQLIFPWTSSADSVRMKFGIIERVIFIFMFLFVTLAFVSIIIHWHISYKLILSVFRLKALQFQQQNFTPFLVVLVFSLLGIWLTALLTQYQLYHYTSLFYYTIPLFVAILFFTMMAIKKGASK
ncbi:GerAB/ArcD/ProY family transporter [Sporosarcina gallistercoris]|uniref:GerAB/ArcD/ProY family transporter n=1 Tax=Sporosarcina gallistercoris TaxID=2762245 RepID=UPI003D2A0956